MQYARNYVDCCTHNHLGIFKWIHSILTSKNVTSKICILLPQVTLVDSVGCVPLCAEHAYSTSPEYFGSIKKQCDRISPFQSGGRLLGEDTKDMIAAPLDFEFSEFL